MHRKTPSKKIFFEKKVYLQNKFGQANSSAIIERIKFLNKIKMREVYSFLPIKEGKSWLEKIC